jgi:short subunit fatty acids transporter
MKQKLILSISLFEYPFIKKLYHDVGASFIPTAPSHFQIEIGKVVEKADSLQQ